VLYTVTKANKNEALIWKSAILVTEKPPVRGAGTFCPSPMRWYFKFPYANRGLFHSRRAISF
jgi:hypothetical protein